MPIVVVEQGARAEVALDVVVETVGSVAVIKVFLFGGHDS
jgi:hypothetical protein